MGFPYVKNVSTSCTSYIATTHIIPWIREMAAANPMCTTSSGIRQPYHIILAGAHDAGKSTIFNTLVTEFEDSYSTCKFEAEDKRSGRAGVQFESFRHKYMEGCEMRVSTSITSI